MLPLRDDHQAFSRNCPIFQRETEIVQVQANERIPRLHAIQNLPRLNPKPEIIFSNAVKNTFIGTASKHQLDQKKEVILSLVRTQT